MTVQSQVRSGCFHVNRLIQPGSKGVNSHQGQTLKSAVHID